jgi:integrase
MEPVKEFIEQKRRRSKSNDTVKAYLTALVHLNNLTSTQYNCTIETILSLLKEGKVDVYKLLGSFVDYLSPKISAKTFEPYMEGVKSYLEYHDIDIIPAKFKKKVTLPKLYREDERAIDVSDVRKILHACHNRRLKTYLLILASGYT